MRFEEWAAIAPSFSLVSVWIRFTQPKLLWIEHSREWVGYRLGVKETGVLQHGALSPGQTGRGLS